MTGQTLAIDRNRKGGIGSATGNRSCRPVNLPEKMRKLPRKQSKDLERRGIPKSLTELFSHKEWQNATAISNVVFGANWDKHRVSPGFVRLTADQPAIR